MKIHPYKSEHKEAIVQLSLRAWAPVFKSIEQAMDRELYQEFYPNWEVSQKEAVEKACEDLQVRVGVKEEKVVGFVALSYDRKSATGEIYMIAVDPSYQRQGICSALTEFALQQMKAEGMRIATVSTGYDPGHAPARNSYAKSGFKLWPTAMYFKKL